MVFRRRPSSLPAVLVHPAELRSMTKQAEFVGRAEALEKVDLRARVPGFIGPRLFKDGDDFKEGQVVFTIEKEPFETTVDQRKAQLASAQARLVNADQQLRCAAELAPKGYIELAKLDERKAEQAQKAAVMGAEANLRDAEIKLFYTETAAGNLGLAARRRCGRLRDCAGARRAARYRAGPQGTVAA